MGSVIALANHPHLAPKSGIRMWSTSWPAERRISAWVAATPATSWTSAIRAMPLERAGLAQGLLQVVDQVGHVLHPHGQPYELAPTLPRARSEAGIQACVMRGAIRTREFSSPNRHNRARDEEGRSRSRAASRFGGHRRGKHDLDSRVARERDGR